MILWHGLSPFELTDVGTGVGRTPKAGKGYNRIELALSDSYYDDYYHYLAGIILSNVLVISLGRIGT